MQKFLNPALLLAAVTLLAGVGYAQQTPAANPPASTSAAPAATTPKTPVKKTGTAAAAPALTTRKQKFSYALGMNIGTGYSQGLKKQAVEVDWNLIAQGMKDAAAGTKTRLTEEEAKAVLDEVQNEVHKEQQEKTKELAAKNKADGEAFLA